ncbi:leukocyte immunoglobulin-like receptor subfamily A member 6, partial [Colossoma macropomum]|uniref:leukocyte immunoglobulin-like receptor subfamily A member 6 n=1 Tax=Colossoma macropomum TaxID=42526 RepID=UPI0018654DF8
MEFRSLSVILLLTVLIHSGQTQERPKAVVFIQPDKQVFIGETVTLRCDTQGGGDTDWQHSWFKDDSSTPFSNEQQYRISSVTESHSGKYTCRGTERGTSRYSHTSDAVTLTVSDKPKPTLTVEPDSPVFSGESVTLKCEINTRDGWTYQWYKQNKQSRWTAVSQSVYYTVNRDTLTIREDAVINGDQYQCRGERRYRPTSSQYSNSVTLTVKERPKAVVSIQPDKQVFIGETVTLRCDIQGEGDTEWGYSWTKDDYPSYTIGTEQEVKYISVEKSHSGKYTCKGATHTYYSQISDAVTLTVS